MLNPKFAVGYNYDYEGFIALLRKYNNFIESIYFPIPQKYMGSGRILTEPLNYEEQLTYLMEESEELGIHPFMLLNSTMVSAKQMQKTLRYVQRLYGKKLLRHVVVTDPYLIRQIKHKMPEMFVEASTLCRIKNVQEAKYFKELGVDRITCDREIVRDVNSLKKISNILPLKVIANEGCIKNCIYKYSHYNMLSANSNDSPILPLGKSFIEAKKMIKEMDSQCVPTIKKHPHKVFSSPFIRPEDLQYYENVTDIFKLSTRNFDTDRLGRVLKAFTEQKHDGNLVELLNAVYIDEAFSHINNSALNDVKFFEKVSSCDDDCDACNYCHNLLEKTGAKLK